MKKQTKNTIRFVIPRADLMGIRDKLVKNETYFIAGSNSISVPSLHTKILAQEVAVFWPDLDFNDIPMTPSEIARVELKREFPDIKKVGWLSQSVTLLDRRPPMFFSGKYQGEAVHIDLSAAYWSVYKRLWLNVLHPCGTPLKPFSLGRIAETLADHKKARNSIMGIIRSRSATAYKGKQVIRLKTKNQFLSPHLWATVLDVLHAVATMAQTEGAIYICTDGYIFPSYENWRGFSGFLDDYGFKYTTNEGYADIRGWGAYTVSDFKTTIPFSKKRPQGVTYPINNLSKEAGIEWRQLQWWRNLPEKS